MYRIEIPIEAEDKYSSEIDKASRKVSSFEKEIEKTQSRVERMNRKRWEMTLRAKDYASRVIRNVSMFAQRVTRRAYRITVRALDYATRPLRSIMGSISSILATAGIVGGVAGGLVLPLKMTIERQNMTTAFEVLLGSADAADKRIRELTEFAGQTPYARDEIYEASRILEVFTKGALSTGDGLRLVGNVAAGTRQPFGDVALWMGRLYDAMAAGRPVGEMTSRLQEMGAISGDARDRIEKLAKSGANIKTTWPRVTKEFARYNGMMEKLSDNLANLLLGVKTSFVNNVLMRWGQGIEKALSPALSKFRDWRKENEKGIQAMGDAIERYGEKFTNFFVDRANKGFSYINELFFSDKYKDLSFGAKVRIMIDDSQKAFSEWWENTGREQVTGLSGKMGTAFGEMINGAILGALGVESEGGSTFVSAGFEAGSSFVKGFLDGLDAGELSKAIGSKILEVNVNAAKGEGSVIGAGIVDLIVLGLAGRLLRPLKGPVKWGWDKIFGKGGKPSAPVPKPKAPHTPPKQPTASKPSRPPKKPVILDQYGRPLQPSGSVPKTPKPKSKFELPKLPKWMTGKSLAKLGGKALARLIPGLGWGLLAWDVGNLVYDMFNSSKVQASAADEISGYAPPGKKLNTEGSHPLAPLYVTDLENSALSSAFSQGIGKQQSVQPFIQENVYQPIHQAVSNATAFGQAFAGNFVIGINQASVTSFDWISQQLYLPINQAIGNATLFGQAYSLNFVIGMQQANADIHPWISTGLYQPTLQAVGNSTLFGQAYAKNFEYGLQNTPIDIHSWISESLYQPILQAIGNATLFGSAFVENFIVGLRSRKAEVAAEARAIAQAAESGLRSKGAPASKKVTDNWAVGTKYAKYADGGYINHPHLGLVGEAGPEMIIPLSSGRRSRALELFSRTGEMLGVRPYADGGMVGRKPVNPIPTVDTITSSSATNVQVGDINIEITVQGLEDTSGIIDRIKDEFGLEFAKKVREALSNMTVAAV